MWYSKEALVFNAELIRCLICKIDGSDAIVEAEVRGWPAFGIPISISAQWLCVIQCSPVEQKLKNETHTHTHTKGIFLEQFTGCGPASPTIAVYQWRVWEPSGCSVHVAGSLSWSLVYIGILKWTLMPVKEWTCQWEQTGKESELPSMSFIKAAHRRCGPG